MRKIHLCLVMLIIFTGSVFLPSTSASGSAQYWIGTYNGTILISPAPVLSLSDGSALFVSYVKGGLGIDYSVLRKIAPNGSVEWAIKYGEGVIINSLAKTPDDKIVTAGMYFSNNSLQPDGFLMEVDKKGKVLWAKRYGGNGTDSLSVVTVLKNGDVLAAGMTTSFKDARGNVWLLKTDSHGNVIWERTYGTEWKDEPLSMLVESNGDILIVGVSIHGNVPYGLILAVDSSGKLIWAKEYKSDMGLITRGLSYFNGGIYVSGYNYLGNNTLGALLMKLDDKGNLLWSESYYRKGFFMLGGDMGVSLKGLWLSGALVKVSSNKTTYYGVLLHISNGTLRDVRIYGPELTFRTLTIASDGSIFVSGVTENNGSKTPLLARLPENGSLPNCKYLANLTVEKTSPEITTSFIKLNTGEPKFTGMKVRISTKEMNGNVSLLCTYTPPTEKEKGICGPGFVVLLTISIAILLRKR